MGRSSTLPWLPMTIVWCIEMAQDHHTNGCSFHVRHLISIKGCVCPSVHNQFATTPTYPFKEILVPHSDWPTQPGFGLQFFCLYCSIDALCIINFFEVCSSFSTWLDFRSVLKYIWTNLRNCSFGRNTISVTVNILCSLHYPLFIKNN